jgi:hypothetical protein
VTICGEMLHGASVALLSWLSGLYRTDRPTVRVKSLWGGEEKLENAWSLGVRVLGGMRVSKLEAFLRISVSHWKLVLQTPSTPSAQSH